MRLLKCHRQYARKPNLAAWGLIINALIFKGEVDFNTYDKIFFGFRLGLPQNSVLKLFFYYKGIVLQNQSTTQGQNAVIFKSTLDLIGIGKHDFLTLSQSSNFYLFLAIKPDSCLNGFFMWLIQKDDLNPLKNVGKRFGEDKRNYFKKLRFKAKGTMLEILGLFIQFSGGDFFCNARDITHLEIEKENAQAARSNLKRHY